MSDLSLTFYTTEGCHLCEAAEAILQRTPLRVPLSVDVVDIASSPELVERYGTRIPVLRRSDDGTELGWPFSVDDVLTFLGTMPV